MSKTATIPAAEIIVIRTDNETGEKNEIPLKEALSTLSNYWKLKYAEDTLLAGDTMHTAYAKYELKPKT